MARKRRSFSAADNAAAVCKHQTDKILISQIAEQMQVQPTMIHIWIKQRSHRLKEPFESPRAVQTD